MFAGLRPERVNSLQIIPAGGREISVLRTNNTWQLEKPFAYPAQAAAVEALLGALEKLTPSMTLTAGDLSGHKNADAEFGFDNPQFSLDFADDDQSWHVRVGNKTAPGDGVYLRVVGAAGAVLTDPGWLQYLPHDANAWRDTALVDMPATVDWIVLTNGAKVIELRRDVTNHLWHMVRPLQTCADSVRITTALQQLRNATVSRFVTDDPKADLTTYGLQPALNDIWLGSGTNLLAGLHVGNDVAGSPGLAFARRDGWNAVVTTAKESLAPWRGTVNEFRDPKLIELTAPVGEIDVRGPDNFTLEQRGTNAWTVAGGKFPVDTDQVAGFVRSLAGLTIADFVQDVVTGPGLQSFGLSNPTLQIALLSTAGNTNSVMAQLLFGAVNTNNNEIYVKRAGEEFVYGLPVDQLTGLPLSGDSFRDKHVWDFSETNVAQVTLRQNGKTRVLDRTGTNQWSLAAGSQGIINPPAVEETIHRLGHLSAMAWVGRKFTDADIGRGTNGLSVTIELKSGEKYALEFGRDVPVPALKTQTPLAAVTLNGERWAFVFPPVLYPLVADYLTIPADTP